jgi:hypothetical protein
MAQSFRQSNLTAHSISYINSGFGSTALHIKFDKLWRNDFVLAVLALGSLLFGIIDSLIFNENE